MNRRRKQSIWLRRNLPLLIAVAALVLLVLIIVLVARGCSKGSDTVIQAKAFSTGTTIDLPLSAELNESDFVSYGGYQFTTKKKLSALSKLITKNNDGVTAETREKVATLVRCIDDAISIHDFRMVPGPTHTNVIFDAVVPYGFRLADGEVAEKIRTAVRTLDGNYFAVVNVEHSYT